jgi:ferritin-like metal-binding protein YciE
MKIETLDDLFYDELRELYDEEKRLLEALPKMARSSASESLRRALEQHVGQTLEHVHRLEQCFRDLGRHTGAGTANAMKGLIKDGEKLMDGIAASPLRDIALIGAARRVEQYEIASYSESISMARLLGHENIAQILEETLHEEQAADEELNRIGVSGVNNEARQFGAHPQAPR